MSCSRIHCSDAGEARTRSISALSQALSHCATNVYTSRVQNSIDPDQLASVKPPDWDLDCFESRIYPDTAW